MHVNLYLSHSITKSINVTSEHRSSRAEPSRAAAATPKSQQHILQIKIDDNSSIEISNAIRIHIAEVRHRVFGRNRLRATMKIELNCTICIEFLDPKRRSD